MARTIRKQLGFTIIQLMVALSIASAATVATIPKMQASAQQRISERAGEEMTQWLIAARHFRQDFGAWPADTQALVDNGYMNSAALNSPFSTAYALTVNGNNIELSVNTGSPAYAKLLSGTGIPVPQVAGNTVTTQVGPPGEEVALDAYLPRSGVRPMTGNLDMGNNNIESAGSIAYGAGQNVLSTSDNASTRITSNDASAARVGLATSDGVERGRLSANNSNDIGIQNSDGNWTFRSRTGGNTVLSANGTQRLTLDGNGALVNGDMEADDVVAKDWFHNIAAGEGIMNDATGTEWFSPANGQWVASGGGANNSIRFRDSVNGPERGGVLATQNEDIGFIDAGGTWAMRHRNDLGTYFSDNNNTQRFSIGPNTLSGSYGTVETKGAGKGGWSGYNINGDVALMYNESNGRFGLFDDLNNDWALQAYQNAEVILYYNGNARATTSNAGLDVTGNLDATGSLIFGANNLRLSQTNGTFASLRSNAGSQGGLQFQNSANGLLGEILGQGNSFGFRDSNNQWLMEHSLGNFTEFSEGGNPSFRIGANGITGDFGTVQTVGAGRGGFSGYGIDGEAGLFRDDGSGLFGLFDDANDQWGITVNPNAETSLYYAGLSKLNTTNYGTFVSGTLTASQEINAYNGNIGLRSNGLYFEGDKHAITWNDGKGNFNIRVGNGPAETITEDGYAFHTEYTQSNGNLSWQISQKGLTGDAISWDTALTLSPNGTLSLNGDQVLTRSLSDAAYVNVTGDTMSGTLSSSVGVGADIFSFPGNGSGSYLRRITNQGGLALNADSTIVVYAGDNHSSFQADLGIPTNTSNEDVILAADRNIRFVSNYQNGIGAANEALFSNDGTFYVSSLTAPKINGSTTVTGAGTVNLVVNSTNSRAALVLNNSDITNGAMYASGSGIRIGYGPSWASNTAIHVNSNNGFVGIKNTAPLYELDVTGDIYASKDIIAGTKVRTDILEGRTYNTNFLDFAYDEIAANAVALTTNNSVAINFDTNNNNSGGLAFTVGHNGQVGDASYEELLRINGDSTFTYKGNRVLHEGVDGAGSGFDTDFLDSLDSTQFLRSDVNDTMNAQLTINTSGTIGTTNFNNGHLKIGTASDGLALDPNEIFATGDLIATAAGGNIRLESSGNVLANGLQVYTTAYRPYADHWTNSRTMSLSGDLSGSVAFNGASNFTINGQVANDSHLHDGRYYTEAESDDLYAFKSLGYQNGETGRFVYDTGIYSYNVRNTSTGKAPNTNAGSVLTWGNGAGGSAQLSVAWTGYDQNEIYFRSLRNTTDDWYSWKKIYHSGNDGPSSGLNADLFDNLESTQFLRSDVDDTINGKLTIASSGTIGTSNFNNGWLQIGNASDGLALDPNEIYATANLTLLAAGGDIDLRPSGIASVNGSRIFTDAYHPNADRWTTARTMTLSGDLAGSVTFDGSSNFTINGQVANDSHFHDGRYFTETESDGRYQRTNFVDTSNQFLFRHRNSSNAVAYFNQTGTGDIARFYAGSVANATSGAGVVIANNGSITTSTDVIIQRDLLLSTVGDQYRIGADDYENAPGITIRPADSINPSSGDKIFTVRSGGGSPRFFVEHDGRTGTSNSDFFVGVASDSTGGNRVYHDGYHPFADDAALLGGLTKNQFMRSDQNTSTTGDLYIGADAFNRNSANFAIGGSAGSFGINVQDGSGRVNMRWNASRGTNGKFLVDGDRAWEMGIAGTGGYGLTLKESNADGVAGADVIWDTILSIGRTGFSYLGNTVWTQGNDGAGSLLDADFLDGIDSSRFLRSDIADIGTSLTLDSITVPTINGSTTVTGTGAINLVLNSTNSRAGLVVNNSGITQGALFASTTGMRLGYGAAWASNTGIHINNNNGYVGIRNSAPSEALDIVGNVLVSNALTTGGGITAGGDIRSDMFRGESNYSTYLDLSYSEVASNAIGLVTNSSSAIIFDANNNGTSHSFIVGHNGNVGDATYEELLRVTGANTFTYKGNQVFHEGFQGSGSGLDADTLDGLNSLQFLRSDVDDFMAGTLTIDSGGTIAGTNLDNGAIVITNGGLKLALDSNEIYAAQDLNIGAIGGGINLSTTGGIVKINGGTAWHSGNDGAGSGLDADRLDGLTSAQFLRGDIADIANGQITFNGGVRIGNGVAVTHNATQSRDKYRVWTSELYAIGMDLGYTFGHLNNDYAMTFQMNDDPDRGFWWGDSNDSNAQGAMSLTTDGRLHVGNKITVGSTANVVFHDAYHPNADKWTTARNIALGGDLSGNASIDGSSDITIVAQVADDSHLHDGRYYTEAESDARFINVGETASDSDLLDGIDSTGFQRLSFIDTSNQYLYRHRSNSGAVAFFNQTGSGDIARFFKGATSSDTTSSDIVRITNSGGIVASGDISSGGDISTVGTITSTGRIRSAAEIEAFNGSIALRSNGLYLESDKHAITWNDGGGNFNIRVGNDPSSTITENGFAFHTVWSQSAGNIAWKVSQNGAVGDAATWGTTMVLDDDGTLSVDGSRVYTEVFRPEADKWTTARTVTLGGDLSGSASFDGSGNFTLSGQVANDSHLHDGRYYTEAEADSMYVAKNLGNRDGETGRNVYDTGIYSYNVVNTNTNKAPNTNYGSVITWGRGTSGSAQLSVGWTAGDENEIYFRSLRNTTDDWNAWKKIYHSGNDGPGSGLNADLFDNLESAQFLRSDVDDTLNGKLTVLSSGTIANANFNNGWLQIGTDTGGLSFDPNEVYASAGLIVNASNGNLELKASGTGTFNGDRLFTDGYHPNADRWTTARTLSLTGDLTGSVAFSGISDFTLNGQVANDSHLHDGRYYTEAESDARYLKVGDTAFDSDKLDGLDSTDFQRLNFVDSSNKFLYRHRSHNSAPALYINQTGNGPIALFYKGATSTDTTGADRITFANDATIYTTGSLDAAIEIRFGANNLKFYQESNAYAVFESSNSNTTGIMLRDNNSNLRAGLVASGNVSGLIDGDGEYSIKHIKDSRTEFNINNVKTFAIGSGGVSGSLGTVQTYDTGKGGWDGYSINGRRVFMDNGTTTGIYNDDDNHWMFQAVAGGSSNLYFAGTLKIQTTFSGADVIGDIEANRFVDRNNPSYYLDPASTSVLNAVRVASITDINNANFKVIPGAESKLASLTVDSLNLNNSITPGDACAKLGDVGRTFLGALASCTDFDNNGNYIWSLASDSEGPEVIASLTYSGVNDVIEHKRGIIQSVIRNGRGNYTFVLSEPTSGYSITCSFTGETAAPRDRVLGCNTGNISVNQFDILSKYDTGGSGAFTFDPFLMMVTLTK